MTRSRLAIRARIKKIVTCIHQIGVTELRGRDGPALLQTVKPHAVNIHERSKHIGMDGASPIHGCKIGRLQTPLPAQASPTLSFLSTSSPRRLRQVSIFSQGAARYGTLFGMLSSLVLNAAGKLIIGQQKSKSGKAAPCAITRSTPGNDFMSPASAGCTSRARAGLGRRQAAHSDKAGACRRSLARPK